jgi:hypothetical protein
MTFARNRGRSKKNGVRVIAIAAIYDGKVLAIPHGVREPKKLPILEVDDMKLIFFAIRLAHCQRIGGEIVALYVKRP